MLTWRNSRKSQQKQ